MKSRFSRTIFAAPSPFSLVFPWKEDLTLLSSLGYAVRYYSGIIFTAPFLHLTLETLLPSLSYILRGKKKTGRVQAKAESRPELPLGPELRDEDLQPLRGHL